MGSVTLTAVLTGIASATFLPPSGDSDVTGPIGGPFTVSPNTQNTVFPFTLTVGPDIPEFVDPIVMPPVFERFMTPSTTVPVTDNGSAYTFTCTIPSNFIEPENSVSGALIVSAVINGIPVRVDPTLVLNPINNGPPPSEETTDPDEPA